MLQIEVTGTANAGQIPVWGCDCPACALAIKDARYRRCASSVAIHTNKGTTIIDAGLTDLAERYSYQQLQRVVLTHYHMDHVQGLFHLRWSECEKKLSVYGPEDSQGADDIYKHPGVLCFESPLQAFKPLDCDDYLLWPVPLNHSRPTFGYLLETRAGRTFAYLTDTVGLPEPSLAFLQQRKIDVLMLDCSEPPHEKPPRNHNDLNLAMEAVKAINPDRALLTHISHRMQFWLMENPLPEGLEVAFDGLVIDLKGPS